MTSITIKCPPQLLGTKDDRRGQYLKQGPVLADEPLWVVLASLHGRFNQRGEGLGKRRLLFEGEILFLVFPLAANLQHAGLFEEGTWRNDGLSVALLLLSGCCWTSTRVRRQKTVQASIPTLRSKPHI